MSIVILDLAEDEQEKRFITAKYVYNDDCCIGWRHFLVWKAHTFTVPTLLYTLSQEAMKGLGRILRKQLSDLKKERLSGVYTTTPNC